VKYLCLDYGEKRTGYAVSDQSGSMAFARGALVKKTREAFFADLLQIIADEGPGAVVIGLPLCLDGSDSLTTRRVRNFAQSLARRVAMPLFFMEEAYSSAEAEFMLKTSGQKAYKRDGRVDSLAAARILESFLNQPEDERQGVGRP
jgi:putative Holliday junction resolvase